MADRNLILDKCFSDDGMEDACREITTKPYNAVCRALDEYMKQTVIEAFEYMALNVSAATVVNGEYKFLMRGEWLTKEQLFENFL